MRSYFLILLIFTSYYATAQVGIGVSVPEESAILELKSTDKGFLPTRMSYEQMLAIQNPAEGLVVFVNESSACNAMGIYVFNGDEFITFGQSEENRDELIRDYFLDGGTILVSASDLVETGINASISTQFGTPESFFDRRNFSSTPHFIRDPNAVTNNLDWGYSLKFPCKFKFFEIELWPREANFARRTSPSVIALFLDGVEVYRSATFTPLVDTDLGIFNPPGIVADEIQVLVENGANTNYFPNTLLNPSELIVRKATTAN